jgi:uncharacterized protein YcfL
MKYDLRFFQAVIRCILLPQSQVVIVDDNKKPNVIDFKNGSSIIIHTAKENAGTIRSHSAERIEYMYDFEYYDKEMLEEILKIVFTRELKHYSIKKGVTE